MYPEVGIRLVMTRRMLRHSLLVAGVCVSMLAVACAGTTDDDGIDSQEAAANAGLRAVDITVTNEVVDTYESRSYPHDDFNGDGLMELYETPVYKVTIEGVNGAGIRERREWTALRFMPFYNNPKAPVHEYRTQGFVNSGLRFVPRQLVPQYKPDYEVHNRFSEFGGAIVVKGAFYIHAGPAELGDWGWGAAGCVEVVGNFDNFKKDVLELGGSTASDLNAGVGVMVKARKLFVQYQQATSPNLRASVSRQVEFGTMSASVADPPVGDGEE